METNTVFNHVLIIGVGMMGGSLGLALKKTATAKKITAWGRSEENLRTAVEQGAIDDYELQLPDAVKGVDCIVLGTPTILTESLLLDVLSLVESDVVVTDLASVKGNLQAVLLERFAKVPENVVLAHPIAGSEKSGVLAADADLFVDRHVILTPSAQTNRSHLSRIQSMWESLGSTVVELDAQRHDQVLALTSHLPHLLAYALVSQLKDSDNAEEIFRFSAGGFRDFTRIAGSDPIMWRDIFLANQSASLQALDDYIEELGKYRAFIEASDGESLADAFQAVKSAREKYIKKPR